MLFGHSIMSVAHTLIPIYNITVHENKIYVAHNFADSIIKTPTGHKGEENTWILQHTIAKFAIY